MALTRPKQLLSIGNDPKTSKSQAVGWLTGVLYVTPAALDGYGTVCHLATDGCSAACLATAGRGRMSNVAAARLRRRMLWHDERQWFLDTLHKNITQLQRKAARKGLRPLVRLNGTSDILWERVAPELFQQHKEIQFYDYTKIPKRGAKHPLPGNYRLTFSRSESNWGWCVGELQRGGNVAVVFDTPKAGLLPSLWEGFPVIDGDASDVRHLDPPGHVVGLRAKGSARHDRSGFVVRCAPSTKR